MWNSWCGVSKSEHGDQETKSNTFKEKICAALFYGITSLLVIFTNKAVLTQQKFPYFDFLAMFQFLVTVFILSVLRLLKKVDIPPLTMAIVVEILPISCMFLGNVICGLGGTRSLNLPMFTALRRFSIFMTMLAEYYVLGSAASTPVVVSVIMMVGGALFAAMFDLSFDLTGYTLVFLNNVFTAVNGVWMKRASISGKCSKIGVMYYNSLFSMVAMLLFFTVEHFTVEKDVTISDFPLLNALAHGSLVELSASRRALTQISAVVVPGVPAAVFGYDEYLSLPLFQQHDSTTFIDGYSSDWQHHRSLVETDNSNKAAAPVAPVGNKAAVLANLRANIQQQQQQQLHGAQIAAALKSAADAVAAEAVGKGLGQEHVVHVQEQNSSPEKKQQEPIQMKEAVRAPSTLRAALSHPGWKDWKFVATFCLAAMMGSVLNYSIFLCTTKNSALTTAVVGCLKNVATTYIGMVLFPDYSFSLLNFIGLNISILGSLYYTYVTMFKGMAGFGG